MVLGATIRLGSTRLLHVVRVFFFVSVDAQRWKSDGHCTCHEYDLYSLSLKRWAPRPGPPGKTNWPGAALFSIDDMSTQLQSNTLLGSMYGLQSNINLNLRLQPSKHTKRYTNSSSWFTILWSTIKCSTKSLQPIEFFKKTNRTNNSIENMTIIQNLELKKLEF